MTRHGHQLPGEYHLRNVECFEQILLTICVFAQLNGTSSTSLVSRPTSFARRLKYAPGNQSGMNLTVECIVNHPFVDMEKYIRIGANSTQYLPGAVIDDINGNVLSRRWTRGSSFEVIWYP